MTRSNKELERFREPGRTETALGSGLNQPTK
jgi:hypothetical protein